MIIAILGILGIVLGWVRAGMFGGNIKDRIQWALAHMLAFNLIGLFATIFIERSS